jgi:IS30 family transposase
VGIDERPEVANNRERIGDWEADTIIGKNHKGAIVTLDERKSKSNTSGKAGGLKTVNRSKRAGMYNRRRTFNVRSCSYFDFNSA